MFDIYIKCSKLPVHSLTYMHLTVFLYLHIKLKSKRQIQILHYQAHNKLDAKQSLNAPPNFLSTLVVRIYLFLICV